MVGIEIGDETVRVAEVVRKFKGLKVNSFSEAFFPQGLIDKGYLKDSEKAASFIGDLLKKAEIKNKKVAVSISSKYVFFKKARIYSTTKEMLDRTYLFEAAHNFPFPVEKMTVDYHILSKDNDSFEVLFTAVKNDLIINRLKVLKNAGLTPLVIEPDILSLINLYSFCNGNRRSDLIVKIESDFSYVVGTDFNNPLITYIPYGSNNFGDFTGPGVREFLKNVFTASGRIKDPVERLVLTGSSLTNDIIEILKLRFKTVKNFQPFNLYYGISDYLKFSSTIPVVLGLSLRRENDK